MGMSGYLCLKKSGTPNVCEIQLCLILGDVKFWAVLWPTWFGLYFYKPHSGNQSQSQQHCRTICLVESWWCDVIGVPKNPTGVWRRSLVSAFPNEVWCCLEDVGSIIAQGIPWSFDSTNWIILVGVKFGLSTWDDHENRYSNWTLWHPWIETRRIHVVGCWVKLCHRDGWISVGWFQSSYLLGGIKIKDFKQGLVFSCKSAIAIHLQIYTVWFM